MPVKTKNTDIRKALAEPSVKLHMPALKAPVCVVPAYLHDGKRTTLHIVRHERTAVRPKVILFDEPTVLLDWCRNYGVENAIVGGFDLHHSGLLLGDLWLDGKKINSEPVCEPYDKVRGSLLVENDGSLHLAPRSELPTRPEGDLLQTGPLLVQDGKSLVSEGISPEGFSETAHQFTPDPSIGRHPRAAIGSDNKYVWTIVCDGRQNNEAGLSLAELAQVMIAVGAKDALNLDGGSSTQLVRRGKLLNNPYGQYEDFYPEGFPIRSAIAFYPTTAN
jgi:hypothetical protein